MENKWINGIRSVTYLFLVVVFAACSSGHTQSSESQYSEEITQNLDLQSTTSIDFQALENSVSDAQKKVDSINEEIITVFQVRFSDLIKEYRYQFRCGSEKWPRWLISQDVLLGLESDSSLGLEIASMIEASDLIVAESNDIDVCKSNTSANDFYVLEKRNDVYNAFEWNDFTDPGYKEVFDRYVPKLKDLSFQCKCWNWQDPIFNPTYTAFKVEWANHFVQRTSEFKAKIVDFNSAFKSKVQELEDAESTLESSIMARDAVAVSSTTSSVSSYVAPNSTVKPKSDSNPTQSTDRAVSIRCQDYGNSSTCRVTWSSGRQTWGSPYGSKSGGIVASTDFLDAFGALICVDLYASGGIKTSYC